jgi:hypothetical protein
VATQFTPLQHETIISTTSVMYVLRSLSLFASIAIPIAYASDLVTVVPQEIEAGETATIAWSMPGAVRGYLSGAGLLQHPSSGKITVSPVESTSYVLIFESAESPATLVARPGHFVPRIRRLGSVYVQRNGLADFA